MMNNERKIILIVGLLLLLLGAAYRYWPEGGVGGLDLSGRGDAAYKKQQIEKYKQLIRRKAYLTNELAHYQSALDRLEEGLLNGSTPSLSAVELQNTINQIAGELDINIQSTNVLRHEEGQSPHYLRIPVRISAQIDVGRLKDMLYRIASSPKLLLVTGLSIDSMEPRHRGQLRLTLTVEGVMENKNPRVREDI